ncbi:hypothetical protein [Paraburkholderia sacchari]|uniref:hypothetical protein n=1 Tax=Paraburkholderia sacchari TaxID=159450 RepID=UPI00144AF0AD|nr:hypothetical protein [Paraburkholderia sacchari]
MRSATADLASARVDEPREAEKRRNRQRRQDEKGGKHDTGRNKMFRQCICAMPIEYRGERQQTIAIAQGFAQKAGVDPQKP